jgi:hypothetical protein
MCECLRCKITREIEKIMSEASNKELTEEQAEKLEKLLEMGLSIS